MENEKPSTDNSSKVERSQSSDILKNDLLTTTTTITSMDIGKATLTKFNSLKEWGRNRLRLIGRNDDSNKIKSSNDQNTTNDQNANEIYLNKEKKQKANEKEKRMSQHERMPSYSSSEKGTPTFTKDPINHVRLRDSTTLKRHRGNMLKKEDIHSSSGNWSASSESGRTSIASEITVQPKSSASSSSLNHCHSHQSGGPLGSVPSRRRFLNTSASSSAASDGTATPDLQSFDPFYDDETSSAYSCDTEGYYTSFHVDSGLKTLKEEEPVTPLQSCSALSSSNSFETSVNQTVLNAENEYEIFGRGSTSTTTSSAGTVCTTVLATDSECNHPVPMVPERKSSLTKLNRNSSSTTSASSSTLERSFSSSTMGSTLDRTGTIKRNVAYSQKEISAIVHHGEEKKKSNVIGDNLESDIFIQENPQKIQTDLEHSECSDLEGFDRVERIRLKTEINSGRIPSMCIITPTTSDDETTKDSLKFNENEMKESNFDEEHFGYGGDEGPIKDVNFNHYKRSKLLPLNNMLGKLKGVLPTLKKSPSEIEAAGIEVDEPIYDIAGEYVRICDVSNNNSKPASLKQSSSLMGRNLDAVLSGNLDEETEYVSLNELPCSIRNESNNLLPMYDINVSKESERATTEIDSSLPERTYDTTPSSPKKLYETAEGEQVQLSKCARVLFDAHGKIIYNSDSLKRRKGAHTTFSPGPFVKDPSTVSESSSSLSTNKTMLSGSLVKNPSISNSAYINRDFQLSDQHNKTNRSKLNEPKNLDDVLSTPEFEQLKEGKLYENQLNIQTLIARTERTSSSICTHGNSPWFANCKNYPAHPPPSSIIYFTNDDSMGNDPILKENSSSNRFIKRSDSYRQANYSCPIIKKEFYTRNVHHWKKAKQ